MLFKYALRMVLRGSGNLKRYLIMLAIFEAILLSLTTAPIGYLNEALQLIPEPSLWISQSPPGIEIDYTYIKINDKEILMASSPNLPEAIKLLTGIEPKLNEASIGCELKNSEMEEYLKSKWKDLNVLSCTNTFLDYSLILKWEIFQEISKQSYSKIYLLASNQKGIASPSALNLAKDLTELIKIHRDFLLISLTIILSIMCCILGLRSTSDLQAAMEFLEEIHIPRSNLLLNLSTIAAAAMLIGVLAGYGLASIILPLTLIYLRQALGIPYIYTTPNPLTMISTLPLALISLTSYLAPITLRLAKR